MPFRAEVTSTTHVRAFIVNEFLANIHTPWVPQLPYSPVLTLANFFVSSVKMSHTGKHWDTIENISAHVTLALKDITD